MTTYTTIVSTEELARHLDDPDWVVFDCRFTLTDPDSGLKAYQTGHVPGARYAHLNHDLSSEITSDSGRHPLPDPALLAEKLGRWGVDERKQVVVYDDSFGAMACRMWWVLRWLGHENVALLDGGYPRWLKNRLPVTAALPAIRPTTFHPRPDDSMWVDTRTVEQSVGDSQVLLVDARPEDRFNGEREPLDKVAGHVPGSINFPFEDNLDLGGAFLPAEELREIYADLLDGASPGQVIQMCGSGVTACHSLIAMEHVGLKGARLYPGSWSAWITDPGRPVETGE